MIINHRKHGYHTREGAKRLHKVGKPKETQKKYREAEKWATESGPQVVELARELLRNWDSLQEFRKARKARQPDPDWHPLTVEVEDETWSDTYKTHFVLNPELSREDVQRRISHLRQLDFKPGQHGPWWKLDYAQQKALVERNKNLWIIVYLESLDHKKYEPLYVVAKGSYYEYTGTWSLNFPDNEASIWSQYQPSAQHHNFAQAKGYVSYKSNRKLNAIKDPQNTIVNLASNPVGLRHPFLGTKDNPVTEAEAVDVIRELLIDGKTVLAARYNEAWLTIERIKEELGK